MRFNLLSIIVVVCLTSISTTLVVAQSDRTQNPADYQRQNAQQQPNAQVPAAQANQANQTNQASRIAPVQAPRVPEWYATMTPLHHQRVNQLLDYWEKKSGEVKQYKCEYTRYDYDTAFCNWRDPKTNQLAAASIMQGEIRFAAPDQACYETVAVFDFALNDNKEPDYKGRSDASNKEKWICDGKAIHEFDYENKKLYETPIPPELQGRGLINSPIPFLFGAKKEDVLSRFWVRITTPDEAENEYWLEAVPKKIDDARNYKKLQLVLSRDELFLPIMMQIYAPNYNPKENNMTSRVFEFKNRQKNSKLFRVQTFFNRFVRPTTPPGFERVKRQSMQAHQQFDRSRLTRPAQQPTGTQIK